MTTGPTTSRPPRAGRRGLRWVVAVVVAVLVAATAIVVVAGSHRIQQWTGGDYSADGVDVVHYRIDSRAVGRSLTQTALLPQQRGERPPLLLMLHGRGGSGADWADPALLRALSAQGDRAPVVIGVSGGDHSYFHDRADGAWDEYVVHEVIPDAVRRFGVDPDRVAIGGHSMGGFGAFAVAMHHPERFCAAGGHEPAIWRAGSETAPGAFDDADDFARNDLVGTARTTARPFGDTLLWLDRGNADDFIPGDEAFVAALRAGGTQVETRVWPGTHGTEYLWPHIDEPVAFYTHALAVCLGSR